MLHLNPIKLVELGKLRQTTENVHYDIKDFPNQSPRNYNVCLREKELFERRVEASVRTVQYH